MDRGFFYLSNFQYIFHIHLWKLTWNLKITPNWNPENHLLSNHLHVGAQQQQQQQQQQATTTSNKKNNNNLPPLLFPQQKSSALGIPNVPNVHAVPKGCYSTVRVVSAPEKLKSLESSQVKQPQAVRRGWFLRAHRILCMPMIPSSIYELGSPPNQDASHHQDHCIFCRESL